MIRAAKCESVVLGKTHTLGKTHHHRERKLESRIRTPGPFRGTLRPGHVQIKVQNAAECEKRLQAACNKATGRSADGSGATQPVLEAMRAWPVQIEAA